MFGHHKEPEEEKENSSSSAGIISRISDILSRIAGSTLMVFLGASGEALNVFLNNAYCFAQGYDIFSGANDNGENSFAAQVSFYAFLLGISLSPIFVSGPVYSHYIVYARKKHLESLKLNDENAIYIPKLTSSIKLSILQRILYYCDYISQAIDGMGAPLMIFNLTFPNAARNDKITAFCVASVLGGFFKVSHSHMCRQNILEYNALKAALAKADKEEKEEALSSQVDTQLFSDLEQRLHDNMSDPQILQKIGFFKRKLAKFEKQQRNKIIIQTDKSVDDDHYDLLKDLFNDGEKPETKPARTL